jgi:hypothetical protein
MRGQWEVAWGPGQLDTVNPSLSIHDAQRFSLEASSVTMSTFRTSIPDHLPGAS